MKRVRNEPNPAQLAIIEQLTCPICFEISGKYFQCCEGHTICGNCYPSMNKKCPTCRVTLPAQGIRNRVLEALLDQVEVPCCWKSRGCTLTFQNQRDKKAKHEKNCSFRDRECPICDATICGGLAALPGHYVSSHAAVTLPASGKLTIDSSTLNTAYFVCGSGEKALLIRLEFTSFTTVADITRRYPTVTCVHPEYAVFRCTCGGPGDINFFNVEGVAAPNFCHKGRSFQIPSLDGEAALNFQVVKLDWSAASVL